MRLSLLALALWACSASAATINVTTNVDELNADGDCSLREAVQAANTNTAVDMCTAGDASGDAISLGSISGQTVTLKLGELVLTDGVTVGVNTTGLPTLLTTVDANQASRIVSIDVVGAAEPVAFEGVVFTRGRAERGGAVIVAAGEIVTFTTCDFVRNTATGSATTDGGGGVFSSGSVTVTSGRFEENTADNGMANGGAIMVAPGGTLSVTTATFTANRAARAGGAIESAGNFTVVGGAFAVNSTGINGGAVHMTGAVTGVFTGLTQFTQNTAGMEGGAVWNSATGTLSMTNSDARGNVANGPDADQGGGVVFSDGGVTELTNVAFIQNRAGGAAGSGGGVLNTAGGRLIVTGGQISVNESARAGGGIETNQSGTATGNTVVLNNVMISGNIARAASGFGGGVHITGAAVVAVTGGEFARNTAVQGGGFWKSAAGTLTLDGTLIVSNAAGDGGGIYSDGGGGLTITDTRITANRATGAAGSGGGVYNNGGTITITGGEITVNEASRDGGGIEDNAGTGLTLTDVVFFANSAGDNSPGNGGAIHISGAGVVTMFGGTISGNRAVEGGGLWKSAAGTLTADGTLIDNNTATGAAADQGGGGVYNDGAGGVLTLANLTVSNNDATGAAGSGGGLLNNVGGTSVITGVTFLSNTARRAGGGIEDNDGALLSLLRSTLRVNSAGPAPGNGGGLHITGAGDVTIDSSIVAQNMATNQGGGLWNSGVGQLTVRHSRLQSNTSATGGGIYQIAGAEGVLRVENSLVAANTATAAGGGLAADGALVVIENTTISGNTAASGGGLASGGGRFLISNATVARNTATTAGGGLLNAVATGTMLLSPDNTIVADNTAPTGADLSGTVMSRGYNLFETTDGATVVRDAGVDPDVSGVDPGLQPLADNGGPTLTQAIMMGSPAASAGMTSLLFDQRGFTRRTPSSIGAFEFGGQPVAGEVGPVTGDEPAAFALSPAVPNPFRGQTKLRVTTATSEPVEVALYDTLGRRVQTLYAGTPISGFDVTVDGSRLAPGVYVVRMTGASASAAQRVTVAW